jgi:protein arginine kinase activator
MNKPNPSEQNPEESPGMSCEFCGEEDELLNITQNLGGRPRTSTICASCAYLLGIGRRDSTIIPRVGDLFAAVLDPTGVGPRDNKLCPRCGTSFADLRRRGRAGCSDCYEIFKSEIDSLLRRSGSRVSHRGKLPRSLQQVRNVLVDKPELEAKLEDALNREDYEEAVRLRGLLARLDEGGSDDGK